MSYVQFGDYHVRLPKCYCGPLFGIVRSAQARYSRISRPGLVTVGMHPDRVSVRRNRLRLRGKRPPAIYL
jgi:hypothetical protein